MRAIGRDPVFVERGARRRARRRRRQPLRRLRVLVGPAHPRPRPPRGRSRRSSRRPSAGRRSARRPQGEVDLAEEIARRVPSVEMLRMTSSGTEATMSAIRLARAATGREKLLKFAGAYHGHVDGLLAEAGSGLATRRDPGQPRASPQAATAATVDRARGTTPRRVLRGHRGARASPRSWPSRSRPTWASSRPPRASSTCCASARPPPARCSSSTRSSPASASRRGGAQELTGVMPDLTIMGKVIGGGLPAAAYGGPRELMERVAPAGDVYQAGTLCGQPARGRRRAGHAARCSTSAAYALPDGDDRDAGRGPARGRRRPARCTS